jgi:hypothetical protein
MYGSNTVFHDPTAPSGPGAPRCLGTVVTLRHTTFGSSPLYERSAHRTDLSIWHHTTITQDRQPHTRQDSNQRAVANPSLRPHAHWDRARSHTNSKPTEYTYIFLIFVRQPPVGYGLLFHEVSRPHTTTHNSRQGSSGQLISLSQRPLPNYTQHS